MLIKRKIEAALLFFSPAQDHALIYRTPRVRQGGPEGYGASDPRGTIWMATSILIHWKEVKDYISLKLKRLEKCVSFGEKILYLCKGKQKKNTVKSIRLLSFLIRVNLLAE